MTNDYYNILLEYIKSQDVDTLELTFNIFNNYTI